MALNKYKKNIRTNDHVLNSCIDCPIFVLGGGGGYIDPTIVFRNVFMVSIKIDSYWPSMNTSRSGLNLYWIFSFP